MYVWYCCCRSQIDLFEPLPPRRLKKVRKPTDFGFVLDNMGNMPAMEVDDTRIRGTDVTVDIRYAFGKKCTSLV